MDDWEYNENYQYTPEDMDTSNQFTPSQGIDDFLGGQGNYQIDGNYFGQDQDWGNQNWAMEGQQNNFGGMPGLAPAQAQQLAPQQAGGAQEYLSKLFTNPSFISKGIAALFEGQQNKKMAKKLGQVASNPAMDPFGSQRPFYQQQLQQSVTNPYDSPMVKAQVSNMQRMQDIKDAAAGRRSNNLSSAPGVLATQGAIAQNYMNSLMAPAGANLRPDSGSIAQALSGAAKYDVNGSISPLIRAIQGGISSQELMDLFNTRKA